MQINPAQANIQAQNYMSRLESGLAAYKTNYKQTLEKEILNLEKTVTVMNRDIDKIKTQIPEDTKQIVKVTREKLELENVLNTTIDMTVHDLTRFENLDAQQKELTKTSALRVQELNDKQQALVTTQQEIKTKQEQSQQDITGMTKGQYLSMLEQQDELSARIIDEAFKYYGQGVRYTQSSLRGTGLDFDCSAFVIHVLQKAGINVRMGNTETMFGWNGVHLQRISRSEVRAGDVFVSGTPGRSSGDGGHAGIFLDNNTVIHCAIYSTQGTNGGSGRVYVEKYPDNHFGLQGNFYRVIRK